MSITKEIKCGLKNNNFSLKFAFIPNLHLKNIPIFFYRVGNIYNINFLHISHLYFWVDLDGNWKNFVIWAEIKKNA